MASLILLSCCVFLALSGCSGFQLADQGSTAVFSALSCSSTSMTGSGTDSCTVTLSAAAPSGGLIVSLSSSNAAVTVPGTVTVPANTTSTVFTATVLPVATAQSATLTASAGSLSETFVLQLNATAPTLTVATSGSPSTYGGAVTFTATISSGPTGTVTFYDGGVSIGTGSINGTTATLTTSSLIAGTHTITASWPGNSNYGAVTSGALSQIVNKATPTVSWSTPAAITYGTALSSAQLDASSTVAGAFTYSPAAGTVLKAGVQTLSVTFAPADSADYTAAAATVTLTVNSATQATPAISWTAPAAITYGTALSTKQLDATSTVAGTFVYTPAAGVLPKAGTQTLSVTFTPTDTTDYTTATATVTLTVKQATPAVSWATPAAITYGTALSAAQLDASSTVPGSFIYSPAAGTVLSAGGHAITTTFTPTDSTDYITATATVTLTVDSATQTTPAITWTTPAAITYGTALSATQLNATSTVAGTFAYTPAAGTVLKPGVQTLLVTFTPTNTTDYTTAIASVALTVNQATPAITWASPAAITYGTALSATQLDATASVPGAFVYSPAAGTVLNAGSQTLSVTFTPTDIADYTTAADSVTLTVNVGISTLTVNATSVGFGNVALNQPATQTLTLSSTGTAPVTVNSAVLTGIGFTLSGPTFPETLTPGQTATLNVQFDPTVLGAAAGVLTIVSTSSTNGTAAVALTGTGTSASSYSVDLSWDAPTESTDPVAGYNVYRSPSGTSTYTLLNSSVDTLTTYVDSTVQNGDSYDYIVESIDASGVESVPTSPILVTIP
jgi:hypothetical protein